MEKGLLSEIKELKTALATLIGTSDLPSGEQFSKEALDKASKEFQKLSIERGNWVEGDSIGKYIKGAHYRSGDFIRQEFGFTNYFKRGRNYYYNKKDLIALAKELKDRNIDFARYVDYIQSQARFKKELASANANNKGKKKGKHFQLVQDLRDIVSSPAKVPPADIIREDIKTLKEDFFKYGMSDYVDIYKDNYAMMKYIYRFEKYLDPDLKKRCRKWCENFNYANEALQFVTTKKDVFIPVREEEMIQL